jgi:hypothetical protein
MIVPTRGRPHVMAELIESFGDTRHTAELWIGVDQDDERIDDYQRVLHDAPNFVHWRRVYTKGMVRALNLMSFRAVSPVDNYGFDHVGFMGDDHRPRTVGWDAKLEAAIEAMHGGIAYGNDLLQGANLPTHVVMSTRIVRALGKMAPKELTHLYVDNYWKALGERLQRLSYVPDVVIEHMHPVAGKAEWDDGYRRVNHGEVYANDATAFDRYIADGAFEADVAAVRMVL